MILHSFLGFSSWVNVIQAWQLWRASLQHRPRGRLVSLSAWLKNGINYSKCNEKYTQFSRKCLSLWVRWYGQDFQTFSTNKNLHMFTKAARDFGSYCCFYLHTFPYSSEYKKQTDLHSYIWLNVQILWRKNNNNNNKDYTCKQFCFSFCEAAISRWWWRQ